jgi:hypothetical protein
MERYLLAARHLGQFNAAHPAGRTAPYPWLSRSPLREALKEFAPGLERLSEARREHTFVAQAVSDHAAAALGALPRKTVHWLDRMDNLPQVVCHWDAHRANLISHATVDGALETVAIDWAGVGWGAVGSELSKFLSQTVNFFGLDATTLPALDAKMFEHYVVGLREAGWEGDPRAVRFGHAAASAVRVIVRTASALELVANTRSREAFERTAGVPFGTLVEKFGATLPYYLSLTDEAEHLANQV